MSDKDVVIGSTVVIPTGPPVKQVPCYLIKVMPDLDSKSKKYKMFIATEQPQFNPGFIQTKGFFTEAVEEDIVTGYKEMVAAATQAQILEMWIPWQTLHSVRSLVFKTSSKK